MTFKDRLVGVFRLNADTFEDIEADKGATGQAALVVFLVALFGGISAYVSSSGLVDMSSAIGSMQEYDASLSASGLSPLGSFVNEFVGAFIVWIVWSFLTFLIAGKLFGGDTNMGEMLRTIGFAQAPRMLSVFSFIPCLGFVLAAGGWIMALIASVLAIQRSADLDSFKSFGAVVLSFIAVIVLNLFVLPPIWRMIFAG